MRNKIKVIKVFIHKNQVLLKILSSYVVTGVLLLSVYSYFSYINYDKNSIKEVNSISEKMLEQSSNVAGTLLNSIYSYCYQMYNNDSLIFNALYSKTFVPVELSQINKKLCDEVAANTLIQSIYIYNKQADIVFSNLTTIRSIHEFFDQDILSYIKSRNDLNKPVFIPRKVQYQIYDKLAEVNLISILFKEDYTDNSPDAAFIVNINQDVFQRMFNTQGNNYLSNVFIINNQGKVISHYDASMINKNIINESYVQRIIKTKTSNGYFTSNINGVKYLVTYVKSDRNLGWSFVNISEYQKLLFNLNVVRKNIVLLTIIFVLLCIAISLFYTRNIYKPLYVLIKKIKGVEKNAYLSGEYDYLSDTFDNLMGNLKNLKISIDSYMPAKKTELIKQVLSGDVSGIKKISKEINMDLFLSFSHFLVCIFSIDSFQEFSINNSKEDIALYRFAVINITSEILAKEFGNEAIELDTNQICIILYMKEINGETLKRSKDLVSDIQYNIKKYLNFSITVALGDCVSRVDDIQYSYKNAVEALKYRIIYGKNSLISFDEIAMIKREIYKYPYAKEKQLMDYLKLGNGVKVNELFNEIIEYICMYTYNEILLSLTQLVLATMRIAGDMFDINKENINLDYNLINQYLINCETIDDMKAFFLSLFEKIISILHSKKDKSKDDLIVRILQFIEDNYQRVDLNVDCVADMAGMSTNYIRAIFKEHKNTSLSNYITELRFKKAQELLLKTDYPANRISEMVGFQSGSYFYINFRKFTGVSPDQYRKEHKEIN